MRKRLRKKKHLGEFAEFGRQFIIFRDRNDGFDEFFDWVIEDVVEGNGCTCGGGGFGDNISLVIQLGRRSEDPEGRKERIEKMLRAHPDVSKLLIGKELDLYHEPYEDILDSEPPNIHGTTDAKE